MLCLQLVLAQTRASLQKPKFLLIRHTNFNFSPLVVLAKTSSDA